MYETDDGNHCAIGCFIPKGHAALRYEGPAWDLLRLNADIIEYMPSFHQGWLVDFQHQHDEGNDDGTLHHALALWLQLNPPPDAPANYFD
jgi:hypothetical protein